MFSLDFITGCCWPLGIFIDIYVGWPGRVHDAWVFNNSSIFQKGSNGELFPNLPKRFGSVQVPLLLLGDPAYPLLPRLMKPFIQHGDFTPKQKKINHCLSRARIVIENAFGWLKGRWHCLLKQIDHHTENFPYVVAACITLHNTCEIFGGRFQENWQVVSDDDTTEITPSCATDDRNNTTAKNICNALADHLLHL